MQTKTEQETHAKVRDGVRVAIKELPKEQRQKWSLLQSAKKPLSPRQ